MDVSIIIVNYNTRKLLKNCLSSIYGQTKNIEFEVIVSDNGSTDGSVEMVKSGFPAAVLLENGANLGFGAANNRGAKIARGEYIFFLNSDTVLKNNAVCLFCEFARKEGKPLLGGYLTNENGDIIHSFENYSTPVKSLIRISYMTFPALRALKLFFIAEKKPARPENACLEVDYITGADLFIKTEVFRLLDGFDENFFMYFEDDDLCRRADSLGFTSHIITGPQITHIAGASSSSTDKKLSILEESFLYYMKKHHAGITYLLLKPVFLFYKKLRFSRAGRENRKAAYARKI